MKTKTYCLIIIFLFFRFIAYSQTYTLSGLLTDASTGEALSAANILNLTHLNGTVSNNYGFYSLSLKEGKHQIQFSFIGYRTDTVSIDINAMQELNIELSPSFELQTIEVKSSTIKEDIKNTFNLTQLNNREILAIPTILGEADVLKSLQYIPGVQGGVEGQSGLHVRGGSPDQNLILLDDVPVYNASHLYGFLSVFNADAVKEVKLYKGGFPARYGGRVSSVIDIRMKEGNNKEWNWIGSLSSLSAKFLVEGPIKKDKTSLMISGRRSYIDWLAQGLLKKRELNEDTEGSVAYFFYDFNIKLNHIFGKKDRLYLSAYTGKDNFFTKGERSDLDSNSKYKDGLDWKNITGSIRWNHQWSEKLFSNLTTYYSRYQYQTLNELDEFIKIEPRHKEFQLLKNTNGIDNYAAKIDFDYAINNQNYLKFGASISQFNFNPSTLDYQARATTITGDILLSQIDTSFQQVNVPAVEAYTYIDYELMLWDKLKTNVGVHFSSFFVNGENYFSLQPRLNMNYEHSPNLIIGASFSTMQQYLHLLSNSSAGLPSDRWLPTTAQVRPQSSWQTTLGIKKKFNKNWSLSLEGFYKQLNNVIQYKPGANQLFLTDWQTQVIQGEGKAYGVEVLLKKDAARWKTSIAYTLSWATRQFEKLNNGQPFPYRYDRRHNANIQLQYTLIPQKLDISTTWIYQTGYAITIPLQRYISSIGDSRVIISARNAYRISDYHRLDLGINFRQSFKRFKGMVSIGAYNLYNRENPFYWSLINSVVQHNGERAVQWSLAKTSLLGFIPYLTLRIEKH